MADSVMCCSGSVYPVNDEGKEVKMPFLQRISVAITHTLEIGFASLGKAIGTHPWKFIAASIFLSCLTAMGLLAFHEEQDIDKLWVPSDSWIRRNKELSEESFPSTVVQESIFGVSNNVLTPDGIAALLDIYEESLTMRSGSGVGFSDICLKAGSLCIVTGILEIWEFDNVTIRSLTQSKINADIRNTQISPVYGRTMDLSLYLGEMATDSNGDLTAKAATLTWFADGNSQKEDMREDWEEAFIDMGRKDHRDLDVHVYADRSWSDESNKAIQDDILLLSIGYFIVIVFVLLATGKFNFMEQKAWLTLGGFLGIGLSIIVSMGLGSAFGLSYGPVHSVLPFLLLGLGVDDMFVIIAAMEELSPEERQLDIPKQISLLLKHAGVSITVTSLTDTVAFLVGANTIIPALLSFCVFAGIGIIGLYVLQCTLFTACLAIDMKRIETNRDGCCMMIKHGEDYTPNDCSQKQLVPYVLKNGLARLLANLPFKVFVIVATCGLFGANVYGFTQLEQHFDPFWFIPSDSYLSEYQNARETYFPDEGVSSFIYCGDINYWERRSDLETLDRLMKESPYNQNGTTDSWFAALTSWLNTSGATDLNVAPLINSDNYPISEENFDIITYRFVNQVATRLSSYLTFLPPHNNITASRFPYDHIYFETSKDKIDGMDAMRDIVKDAGFSNDECYPYAYSYLPWETNRIIQDELYRNLGVAMVCVFIVTLLLIASLFTSVLVFLAVIATLIDVAGSMYFWDLTIDTVTSIVLILSIGLAVDYSAHIGHTFMTVVGTRQERTKKTIVTIGAPVFYGGFSTFLAFVLLSQSNSYIFLTFFKVNLLVVIYGLFHGMVFLPVVLSLIGPAPYPQLRSNEIEQQQRPAFQSEDSVKGADNLAFTPNIQNRKYELKGGNHDGVNKPAEIDSSNSPSSPSPSVISNEPNGHAQVSHAQTHELV